MVIAVTGAAVFIYFFLPMLIIAPFIGVFGTPPVWLDTLFLPIFWLYETCPWYAAFLDWQEQVLDLVL